MNTDATPANVGCNDGLGRVPCSHCGFPLGSSTGLRHYGTHTAHQESECLRLLHTEIKRLQDDLRKVRHLPTAGAMTPERWKAFHALESAMLGALAEAKDAGVAQGLIVSLLHGHAHMQTAAMVDAA